MAKRKRGRPALPEAERKRAGLTFRARDALRQRLTDAARLSKRSVSEEIESRLEDSFQREDISKAVKNEVKHAVTASIEVLFSKQPVASEETEKMMQEIEERISKPREPDEK